MSRYYDNFSPARHGPRHGITKTMEAEAATRNLALISSDSLVELADAAIANGFYPNRKTRRRAKARQRNNRLRELPELLELPEFEPVSTEGVEAHVEWISGMLAPSGNDDVLVQADSLWLDPGLEVHAARLDHLRKAQPEVYRSLMNGQLRKAAAVANGAGMPSAPLRLLLEQHARISLIAKANARVRYLRNLSITPFGDRFAGFCKWKTMGNVALSAIAGPASVVQRLSVARAQWTEERDPDRLLSQLIAEKLLPDGTAGRRIFDAARAVEARNRRPDFADAVSKCVTEIFALTDAAARIDSAALAAAGLSRCSFVEAETGLSASEAATFVAIELLKALNEVPGRVAEILGERCRGAGDTLPSNHQIMFASVILRSEGQPDKEASGLGRARGADGGLDPHNRSAKRPLRSLRRKLDGDARLQDRAKRILSIDLEAVFNG